MKKKIFLLPICLLALAACGNNNSDVSSEAKSVSASTQSTPVSKDESSKAPSSSKHTHSWDEGKITTPATCTEDGLKTYTCAGCNETKTEVIPAGHQYGAEETVAASDADHVAYKKAVCPVDNVMKLTIHAVDGKLATGSKIKSGTPSGYMKLNGTNNKISWSFNLAGDQSFVGTLYQRGYMDAFSSNTEKGYSWTSTSGSGGIDKTRGNFEVLVNGNAVDKSAMMDVTFNEMTKNGETNDVDSSGSPIALCQIGTIALEPGENVISYERLGSYNLIISDLVFVGEVHTHKYGAWEEVTAATENTSGLEKRTCSKCGLSQTREIPKLEGYDVTFVTDHCKVFVFESGQDYTVDPVECTTTKTRSDEGVITKYVAPDIEKEIEEVKPQVNFKVVCDEGYVVDGDCIAISGTKGTDWNNIKSQGNGIYRVTVIKTDITITIIAKVDSGEEKAPAHEATFVTTHCSVKVYVGPKDETGSNVDTADGYYSRSKEAPYDYSTDSDLAQFNFEVICEAGYEWNSGIEVGAEVKYDSISFITGTYNKVKNLGDNVYRITKVAGDLTITIEATPIA